MDSANPQPELAPAFDPEAYFAQAATEKPGCKLARVIDRTLGVEFILAFAPSSKYFEFDIDRQTMEIERSALQPTIADLKRPAAAA